MIERTALAIKAAGPAIAAGKGRVWKYLKMRRTGLVVNAAAIVPLLAVGLWVYLVQERSIKKLQRDYESFAGQIATDAPPAGQAVETAAPKRPHRRQALGVLEEGSSVSANSLPRSATQNRLRNSQAVAPRATIAP